MCAFWQHFSGANIKWLRIAGVDSLQDAYFPPFDLTCKRADMLALFRFTAH